jgi:hypothetical protein
MDRMVIEAHWGYYPFVLKNGDVAEKGKLACLDRATAGIVRKGATATGLVPVGVFNESLTGDGVKKISVKLFDEIRAIWWTNDSTTPLTANDIGDPCYIKDDVTVSGDNTGRSLAGMVLAVDSAKGVLVYSPLAAWVP